MSKEKLIDLEHEQLGLVKVIIRRHIPGKTVWAYGSRVTWKASDISDLDLAVFDCSPTEIGDLKEALEESNLLASVDVMDWGNIPEKFRENIKERYVVVQESSVPEVWREVKLGDVVDIKHGYAFKGKYITDETNNNILVTPGNFHIGGGFKSSKLKYFRGEIPQDYILKEDDVIVTMTDLSKQGDTLGYSAKVPKNNENDETYLHNQRIGLLQFTSKEIDRNFIYWLMRTGEYHWFIVGAASGTSIKHTSPKIIKDYKFLLPSLSEQKAIAEVLSSLDDKIDLLHRQNRTLEDMAQALFRKWFVEDVDEEWEVKPLGKTVDIFIGRTPPRKEFQWFSKNQKDWKWISIKDMAESGVYFFNTSEYLTQDAVEKFNIPIIPTNTVILSFKMTVGRVGITTEDMLSNEAIAQFKFNSSTPYSKGYLYFYLKNFRYDSLGSTSSIVTSINTAMIKDMMIATPDFGTTEKFDRVCNPLFDKVYFNQRQIHKLSNLHDTLLPKLVSGKVRLEY